jgi:hypothetical protein
MMISCRHVIAVLWLLFISNTIVISRQPEDWEERCEDEILRVVFNMDNNDQKAIDYFNNVTQASKASLIAYRANASGYTEHNQFDDRHILFFPNHAGLFSQFIQLKLFHHLGTEVFQRNITIVPSESQHYGTSHVPNLCDIFDLPPEVNCNSNMTRKRGNKENMKQNEQEMMAMNYKCVDSLSSPLLSGTEPRVCWSVKLPHFHGPTFYEKEYSDRMNVLRSVQLGLKLKFNEMKLPMIAEFKEKLGIVSGMNYTVVHWRRGDQLYSRCRMMMDVSVNCGGALELIDSVRNVSTDEMVYVATNEKPDSPKLDELEKAGFKIFRSAGMNITDILDIFVVEIALMMDSTTFLGWGMSEVNDVVEFERRREGKSWCVADEANESGDLTWCEMTLDGMEATKLKRAQKKKDLRETER